MSRSGLFNFENEPICFIQDSNSLFFLNRFGRTVSVIRDTRFGIGRTVPAIRDTRARLVVLVYCHARATPRPTSSKCRHDCRLPCGPGRQFHDTLSKHCIAKEKVIWPFWRTL
jgi:hypothetical protein